MEELVIVIDIVMGYNHFGEAYESVKRMAKFMNPMRSLVVVCEKQKEDMCLVSHAAGGKSHRADCCRAGRRDATGT